MDLLRQHVADGRRFVVSDYLEAGDQVSVTLSVSGPRIPGSVTLTKFFAFRPGTNVIVEMKDGVDVLGLRALDSDEEDDDD